VDPGFGFGKHVNHNLSLINHLDKFHQLNLPIMLGISRKSSIGEVLGKSVKQRLIGGISLANYAALKGVGILRMHDVDETHQALRMIEAICLAN
jgi:dihydropteroate synthase